MLMFVAVSTLSAQSDRFMHEATYTFTFSDQVKIKIGSAAQNKSTKEWSSGQKLGNHEIKPEDFKKLQDAASNKFTFKIEKKKLGTLHKLLATDLKTGKTVNGIYDERNKTFSFGKFTKVNNTIEGGIVKGNIDVKTGKITNGKYEVGSMAGKAPLIISASATFSFTGSTKIRK